MRNNYGLPSAALDKIYERDVVCVYCRKVMTAHTKNYPRKDWYTIEHLNYLPPWNNPETVVMCCWSCNSSRGAKKLMTWFGVEYCIKRGISKDSVTQTVRNYIEEIEEKEKV